MTREKSAASPELKVVKIVSPCKLVINKGTDAGLRIGQRFLIYNIGEEIKDPDTNESLGNLELVRGTGKIVHLQERMAHIQTDMTRHVNRTRRHDYPFREIFLAEETISASEEVPFEDVQVGDFVKPI